MEAIYGYRGAKAGYTSGVAKLLLMEAARRLVRRGAEVLILGCTEVPLLLGEDALLTDHGHVACLDTTRLVAERLREAAAQGLTVGVAGGMGPEATIDMLWKLGVERSALDVLWEIVHTTATFLKRRQDSLVDQDHLKFVFLQTSSRTSRRCASSRIKPWTVVDTAGDCPAGTRPRRYWSGSVDRLVRESLARRANLG